MWRLACPAGGAGGGGLTMSEEGGLEEVEESLRAEASCCWSWPTAACSASIWRRWASSCACKRSQFGQGLAEVPSILPVLRQPTTGGTYPMNDDEILSGCHVGLLLVHPARPLRGARAP